MNKIISAITVPVVAALFSTGVSVHFPVSETPLN